MSLHTNWDQGPNSHQLTAVQRDRPTSVQDKEPISVVPVNFFVRLSCSFDSSGAGHLVNDVPGDNQIGLGTTKTTWNLQ
jgi:hypothetical protein